MNWVFEHDGYKVDDIVDVAFASGDLEIDCRVLEMYKTREGRVRVMVRPLHRHGAKFEVDSKWIRIKAPKDNKCKCKIRVLMSFGCQCGGV